MNTVLAAVVALTCITTVVLGTPKKDGASLSQNESPGLHHQAGESSGAGPGRMAAVEFENDSVRVVRIRIGPREKVPMHDVTPRVVVWLTDEHLRLTFADGTSAEDHHKAGQTSWLNAQRHAGENLSDQPIEFLAVILKK